MKSYGNSATVLTVSVAFLSLTCSAFGGSIAPDARALLLEARTTAASVKNPSERSSALESLLLVQVSIDPSDARESLRMFPNLPNKPNNLFSLAFNYAKAGNIKDTEEIYAEIMKEDGSDRRVRLATANILGYVAVAYANSGKLEEAFRILAQLKEQFKSEPFAIFDEATALVAQAQAKHGDVAGAIETAKTLAGENPYPLMSIIGGRVRANDMPGALRITSGLEEGLRPYAKWGIVSAQRELGDLKDAQITARTIKPGHARASALLELANHYVKTGERPTALLLLHEAAQASLLTYNNWTRADIMWRVAAAMASAGDAHDALKLAKSIEKDGHRTSAISDIVKAQATQGKYKEAFDTALLLKNADESNYYGANAYAEAIGDILAQITKSGRAKEALESVRRFDDLKPQHQSLYCAIAVAQADAGDIQGATSTLSFAESDALQIIRRNEMTRLTALLKQREDFKESRQLQALEHIDYEIHAAHKELALAYARQGSFAEASNIAFDSGIYDKGGLIQEIGKVAAEAGHKVPAITWARAMSSPSDKAYGLIGIARALSAPTNKPAEK